MAKNSNKTILVTGATGKQGSAAWRHLREAGFPTRAFTRDPDSPKARTLVGRGAEVVSGDLNDREALGRAMDGVYGVYSVQPSADAEAEVKQGINVAEAARRQRVSHLVYSSVGAADKHTGIPHFESKARIEEHIRNTGVSYTILRPVFFMENLLAMRQSIENGALAFPLKPETRLQMIAVDDIGGVAALAFQHSGHWQGRAVELAGDELSMTELVAALGHYLGREIGYRQLPWDEFEKAAGQEMTTMWRWFETNGYTVDIATLRQEYPGLTSLQRWLPAYWRPQVQTA